MAAKVAALLKLLYRLVARCLFTRVGNHGRSSPSRLMLAPPRRPHQRPRTQRNRTFARSARSRVSGAGSPAMLAEPSGELAGPADRAQPALGLPAHGGGGDDKQAVAGLQRRGVRRDEPLTAADDQRDVGLGGQP